MTAFTVKSSLCLMADPFQIFLHEATHEGGDIEVKQLKMKSYIEVSFMYSQSHTQIVVVKVNKKKVCDSGLEALNFSEAKDYGKNWTRTYGHTHGHT